MTTDELISYYQSLLIIQYSLQPRAQATVNAFVSEVIADQIVQQVNDGFDLNTAIGSQLDAIATYRGAMRALFGIDLGKEYFITHLYDDANPDLGNGFALYGDTPSWYFIVYADANQLDYFLNDDELRNFVAYLADVQSASLGLGEIDLILFKYFGSYVTLIDGENMTITYTDDPSDPNILFKIVNFTHTFPKPAGVQVLIG